MNQYRTNYDKSLTPISNNRNKIKVIRKENAKSPFRNYNERPMIYPTKTNKQNNIKVSGCFFST